MAGKSNTSATFFAQKKLLGKAHTSNLKTDGEELIGSNIQSSTSLLFGESIPDNPSRTLNLIQSASLGGPGTVEYIQFTLESLDGTTYVASDPGGGAGSDSGESSQSGGPHTYKFKLPSDYTTISSNPNKGNGVFDNNKVVHETLGSLQLVPPFYSQAAPNPYIIKIYKDNGSGGVGSEIPLLDNIDWNVDYYNGILFLQDYDGSKIPAHARAFAYIGKMADDVIASISGGGGGSGDTGAQYLVLSNTGSLSNERVFTPGVGISTEDAGANGNFTVSIDDSVVATLTSSVSFSNGISGSLTQLSNGSSYIKSGTGINVVSESNGSITLNVNKELVFNELLTGNTNGSNTLFTLANTPFATNEISIFVNGQLQTPPGLTTFQDYSVTGSNVFFTTGSVPEEGSLVMAIYQKVVS